MARIKLTKNELRRQKEALKRFRRYLPMLLLKKQQLQAEIFKIHKKINELEKQFNGVRENVFIWADVFAEDAGIDKIISVEDILTENGNIAGLDIPLYKGINFKIESYDLMLTPLWVDSALVEIKRAAELNARLIIADKQSTILQDELRITTQRVNLFEKIKIPEAKENIRFISIYLGELQTQEVVRGKIAKAKIERTRV
ncbi:MAG: V-type ATP synthase subunit D [Candidatus Omnitrophota bacterium]